MNSLQAQKKAAMPIIRVTLAAEMHEGQSS